MFQRGYTFHASTQRQFAYDGPGVAPPEYPAMKLKPGVNEVPLAHVEKWASRRLTNSNFRFKKADDVYILAEDHSNDILQRARASNIVVRGSR
jgi:hypothetical protein